MLRWFSNHLLVDDLSPDGLFDAIRKGRNYAAFEIYGSPVGFDYRAEQNGATFEMGDTTTVGSKLTLDPPTTDGVRAIDLRLRILRVDAQYHRGSRAATAWTALPFVADQPGTYRAEVRITPTHLKAYVGASPSMVESERVWIYTNPIYVQ